MSNLDVEGKTPFVGAKVVLAGAGRGASEMWVGQIISLHPKSVKIAYIGLINSYCGGWKESEQEQECFRNAGCYYIIGGMPLE